jgi:hypothetical protein
VNNLVNLSFEVLQWKVHRALVSALLSIPSSQVWSVRLESVDSSQESVWSWEIEDYTHSEKVFRKHEYICRDVSGRVLTVVVRSYIRGHDLKVFVIAYGSGSLFTG